MDSSVYEKDTIVSPINSNQSNQSERHPVDPIV